MQVMYFCTLLLTTHFLGSEIRGEISLIQLAINMVHLVSDIVGGPALVYLVPRTKLKTLLIAGWFWAIFSSVGIGSIFVWQEIIPEQYTVEVLVAAFLLSLNSINMNILMGQERIREFNILLYLQGILMFITMASAILILHHDQSIPYLEACYAAYGGCFLMGLYFVLKKKHEPKLRESRPILFVMLTTGLFTQLATLAFQLSIRLNYLSIENHIHDKRSSVGIYSTAVSLGEAILLFSASVATVLMSRISNERLVEVSRKRTLQLSKLSLGITACGVGVFALMPPEFYAWLLGPQFAGVRNSFLSITPGIVLVSFGTVFGHFFSGSGKHYMNFFSGTFALIMTIATADYLVRNFGIMGAGWSASLAYGSLSVFIFTLFMLMSENRKAEWKELLPVKSDFTSLLQVFRSAKEDKASAE